MTRSALEIVRSILADPKNLEHVRSLVTPDVTYVSLSDDDPDLRRIMPWCGTSHGPEAIVRTFVDVGRYWKVVDFRIESELDDGENAAIFGRFTYESVVLSQTVTSPFAMLCKASGGVCHFLQFMEDSFATAKSFRRGGSWTIASDPDGNEIEV